MRDWNEANPFVARAPWWGGDLQTLRNTFVRGRADLTPWPGKRLALPMRDGSGDALAAALHRPMGAGGRPLVVLVHGLTGCEDSAYIRASAARLLGAGHPVLRLNLRGAGPSRALCRLHYHAGRTQDLRDALAGLDAALLDPGIIAVGYSLGGNMLLKYLAEEGEAGPVRLAVAVSAPIDLAATAARLGTPRNAFYKRHLLSDMKAETQGGAAEVSARERAAIQSARAIYEFDDRFSAPRNGFAGGDDYYARCAAGRALGAIRVPTLLIHALDDPWVPGDAYARHDWAANGRLMPLLSPDGGHVGFHGRCGPVAWHDQAIAAFLDGY